MCYNLPMPVRGLVSEFLSLQHQTVCQLSEGVDPKEFALDLMTVCHACHCFLEHVGDRELAFVNRNWYLLIKELKSTPKGGDCLYENRDQVLDGMRRVFAACIPQGAGLGPQAKVFCEQVDSALKGLIDRVRP